MADVTKYTVGWICALPNEFNAAKAFLDERHEDSPNVADHDNNSYALGRIGYHHVVVAVLPDGEYGTTSAAVVAQGMLHSFSNVRIGLMVGIGGGAPSSKHDVRLGDVVVSSRGKGKGGVFQYDFGKLVQNQDVSFEHTDFLDQPPMVLRAAVSALKSQYEMEGHQLNTNIERALAKWPRLRKAYARPPSHSDRLYRSDVLHPTSADGCNSVCGDDTTHLVHRIERDEDDDNPAIHHGLVASSNQLMKNATIRDNMAKEKGVLCFEMEAAGLMNHFPCLVIRGICDYSDSHKNKNWQGFAAMTAAAYATDLLRQVPPNKVEAEKRISDVLSQFQEGLSSMHKDVIVTKTTVTAFRNDQHLEKLHRWLLPSDPSTNAKTARDLRHAGTGTWLLESAAFREWEAGQRQHLWLYGLAGCGKTVLSTTILDDLEKTGAYPTLSFFFDFKDERKQTLDELLRSLACQLHHAGAEAAKRLDSLFTTNDEGRRQPDVNSLSACVKSMLQSFQKVAVILDALDECTTRGELLSWIMDLVSKSNTCSIKLIVTGRPEAEFQCELPQLFGDNNCKLLDKGAVNADIHSYVDYQLNQRPDFKDKKIPHDLLEQIRSRVGNGADGMFRWAACQLDTLAKCLHPQAIRAALRDLPRDLNETYQRMLQSIHPDLKNDAFRLLQFLIHAKRPLTVSEAIDVIATLKQKGQQEFNAERRLLREDYILYYGPGLVSIAEVTRDRRTVREIQIVHFSVKEYLISRSQFKLDTASSAISTTCFTYIRGINCSLQMMRTSFPLARYAGEVTMEHARLAETSNDVVQDTVTFFEEETTFRRWGYLYHPDRPWDHEPGLPIAHRLYYACFCGLLRVSGCLISQGADVNAPGGYYGNALQAASCGGHQEVVWLLLTQGADVNKQGGEYGNALQAASKGGYQETVQLLLRQGADVNKQGGEYGNALQAASYGGHQEVVQLLLSQGANVNAQGGRYVNALYAASEHGHQEIVRLFLSQGADVNAQGSEYGNALQAASYGGHQEVVQLLLSQGANVNAQGGRYVNALYAASEGGHQEIVRLLLGQGGNVNAQGGYYGNALQAASERGHQEIVRLLLSQGANVNAQGGYNRNALQAASEHGYQEIVRLLLSQGADVNAQGGGYGNALHAASYGGHQEIVRLLLSQGADINAQGVRCGNALQAASSKGHQEIIQLLLSQGANVNAQGGEYGNALYAASEGGYQEIVRLLLSQGADVNTQGGYYGNALQATSSRGNQEVVQLLLSQGADVNAQGGRYGNALHAASYGGHQEIVRLLLSQGADINAQGGYYGNALYAASERGHQEIVQLLLSRGANVNAQGGYYGNALQTASSRGHQEVVRLLLSQGADVNVQGGRYHNALQAASYGGHQEIVRLLLSQGADVNAQGGRYGNALYAASDGGYQEIVRLLLGQGALAI